MVEVQNSLQCQDDLSGLKTNLDLRSHFSHSLSHPLPAKSSPNRSHHLRISLLLLCPSLLILPACDDNFCNADQEAPQEESQRHPGDRAAHVCIVQGNCSNQLISLFYLWSLRLEIRPSLSLDQQLCQFAQHWKICIFPLSAHYRFSGGYIHGSKSQN